MEERVQATGAPKAVPLFNVAQKLLNYCQGKQHERACEGEGNSAAPQKDGETPPNFKGKKKNKPPFNYFSDVDAVHWQKSRRAMNPRLLYKIPVYSSSYGLLEKKLPFLF